MKIKNKKKWARAITDECRVCGAKALSMTV